MNSDWKSKSVLQINPSCCGRWGPYYVADPDSPVAGSWPGLLRAQVNCYRSHPGVSQSPPRAYSLAIKDRLTEKDKYVITKWLKLHKKKKEEAVIEIGRGDNWLRAHVWDRVALGGEDWGKTGKVAGVTEVCPWGPGWREWHEGPHVARAQVGTEQRWFVRREAHYTAPPRLDFIINIMCCKFKMKTLVVVGAGWSFEKRS